MTRKTTIEGQDPSNPHVRYTLVTDGAAAELAISNIITAPLAVLLIDDLKHFVAKSKTRRVRKARAERRPAETPAGGAP